MLMFTWIDLDHLRGPGEAAMSDYGYLILFLLLHVFKT